MQLDNRCAAGRLLHIRCERSLLPVPAAILAQLEASARWGQGCLCIANRDDSAFAIAVNHQASGPLFVHVSGGSVESAVVRLADAPDTIHSLDQLNLDACLRFLAHPFSCGPFEVSVWPESFHRDWLRVPPGFVLYLKEQGEHRLCPLPLATSGAIDVPLERLREQARADFDGAIAASSGGIAVEFSGGIDSSLVLAACRHLPRTNVDCLSYDFDHHEFRRERHFRQLVNAHGGAPKPITRLPPTHALPFYAIERAPQFVEPSINATSWAMFDTTLRAAAELGAATLFNGHGGDLLFLVEPQRPIVQPQASALPPWLTPALLTRLQGEAETVLDHLNRHTLDGIGGYWHPAMLHPAALSRYAERYHPNVAYRSGIVSRDFYDDCIALWRHFEAPAGTPMQKPFAHALFAERLPDAVWRRSAKVNHLGNVFRGIALARPHIVALCARHHALIDALGLQAKQLGAYINKFSSGVDAGNPMSSQLIALLMWWDGQCQGQCEGQGAAK